MIFTLLQYSYYLNYTIYFLISYYTIGTINMSHDIYNKYNNYNNKDIMIFMANLNPIDDTDWIIID